MKLFFALWPNAVTRARLERWVQTLHDACGGRRARTEKLHLTLAFLGTVEDARVAEVEKAMESVEARRFLLTLDRPGYWKKNRIVWAGTFAAPRELDALAADLRAALAAAGIAFDPQPFAVHVTLLRDAHPPAQMPVIEPIQWPIDGFTLVASVADPGGARYEVLRTRLA